MLAACSTPGDKAPASDAVDLAEASQPVGTHMPDGDGDLCKAREHQYLVGQPTSRIPVPVEVVNRRVACTTCPVTQDFSPYRLNFFFNAKTDLVEQVRCG